MKLTSLDPFGLQITDFNFKIDAQYLEELVWKNGFVVIKELDTHWSTINDIAHVLGNVADANPVDHPECRYVGQITGQKYEDGTPKGRMGKTTEIGWHSDNCVTKKMKPFIMFQGIENVTQGTQEYLYNNIVYNSLTNVEQDELKNAYGNFFFNHDVFQNDLEDVIKPHSNWKKLIVTSPFEKIGLFYPWLFCTEIKGTSDNKYFFNLLKTKFENAKIYRHTWNIGDLFITESLFTQHRRPPTENASERLLYRVNCGKEYTFED